MSSIPLSSAPLPLPTSMSAGCCLSAGGSLARQPAECARRTGAAVGSNVSASNGAGGVSRSLFACYHRNKHERRSTSRRGRVGAGVCSGAGGAGPGHRKVGAWPSLCKGWSRAT